MRQTADESSDREITQNEDRTVVETSPDEQQELRVVGKQLSKNGLDQLAELLLRLGHPRDDKR